MQINPSMLIKNSALVLVASIYPVLTSLATETCVPFGKYSDGGELWNIYVRAEYINQPGSYCLKEDVTAQRLYVISEGGEKSAGETLLSITASNAKIDLNTHTLNADRLGVIAVEAVNQDTKNINIYNGTIRSRTSGGVLLNGLFSFQLDKMVLEYFSKSQKLSNHSLFEKTIFKERLTWLKSPDERDQFPATNHLLDNLSIQASNRSGIEIKGASNTVRNSTITSNGGSGVVAWGARQVIENNTIIFKGQPATPSGAPIKLHLADNTIIRNNTIIIEGGGDKPEAAISIIDSKNVVIENNKIIGTKVLYKIWDEEPEQKSSVIERGNEFVSWWGRLFGK